MKRMWCISEINQEFRERMYKILDLYEKPYDPRYPVVGFDEKPKQLIEDMKKAVLMTPGHRKKCDYEYIRRGNANILMAIEFKAGKRTARVTSQRTKRDFSKFIKHLVDRVYPDAERLHLVLDNLNTHNESAIYEMYDSEEAERILSKIEFHYTPLHASWLNVAEIEIGVMDTECTQRRIPDKKILRREVMAWERKRNKLKMKINWKFTKRIADEKLSSYYV